MRGFRGQINLLVAVTMSVVLLAFLIPLSLLLRREAEQRAIADATLRAQSTAALLALNPGTMVSEAHLTVFRGDGTVSGAAADRSPAVELASRGNAFAASTDGGVEVLVPVQSSETQTAVVRVFVPTETLHKGVGRTWLLLGTLCAALLLIGVLVADRLARRVVGSVTDLATVAHRLAGNDLSARVRPHGAREVIAVGTALNRLAERIGELLAAEREDAANLAHRLRTPVTALRLDVEAVPSDADRARLTSDVDDLSRAIDEIIRTARRPVREGLQARADLSAVVIERARFWSALAEDTGRSLSVHLQPHIWVRAAEADLIATVDAVLENVFSHTPDGTAAEVHLSASDGVARLVIADHGPGFAQPPRRGLSGAGSTGLGLDIARRTTESAGGGMELAPTPGGGATVALWFPRT